MARPFLRAVLVSGWIALLINLAHAQEDFPNRPIHVIVPYPAGGIVDIVARAVAEQVGKDWNQPVIVEAKPGANSNIGTAFVARAPADGYTWLVTGPAVLVNPTLDQAAAWNPLRDFKCVGLAVWNQSVAIVPASLPVRTFDEFVALARAQPGELNFGNPGVGSSIDLSARKLFQSVGIKLVNVAYKGQPPALLDLIRGEIHFEIVSLLLALPHIKEGTVKPLAVMTHDRVKELPDLPTISEAGYSNAAYLPWYGIYVSAKTRETIVKTVNDGINRALRSPEVQQRLELADIPGKPMSLEELAALMKADHEMLSKVVNASGAALQPSGK